MKPDICGVVSASGPNGEPLACAYEPGHEGAHSWAALPTFYHSPGDPYPRYVPVVSQPGEEASERQ